MKIGFHGAAQTVTGSKHLIHLENGKSILLDCGMFQGLGRETDDLNEHFGFNPKKVDALILSHAHIDHSGLIPRLVKEGFTGPIFCTPATRDLAEILLFDSAEIQTYEIEYINRRRAKHNKPPYEALYTPDDVRHSLELFKTFEYNQWFSVLQGVEALFTNAGHLIGSAAVSLRINEHNETTNILFSGDVGRYRSVLLPPPAEAPQADYIILESTYGDKHHDISFNTIETLQKWINNICVEKGGQLIIPAFSVGRTQEVLYALNQLSLEKRLPEGVEYFIDSPLSLKATATIKAYKEQFNDRLKQVLEIDDDPFEFPGLKYVESVEDSKRLVDYQEPCVIISASGTADAGRVKHHINNCIGSANNGILMVGYCGPKSLGGQLLKGDKEVEIFSDACTVAAQIGQVQGMSAHGDCDDLCRFISNQDAEKVKAIFLVHGEQEVQEAFKTRLGTKGFKNVVIPSQHEQIDLKPKRVDTTEKDIPLLDCIIIGGGPAGLNAAVVLGRCRRKVLVFDKGTHRNRYSHGMHNYLTRDHIPPAEFLKLCYKELEKYGVQLVRQTITRAIKNKEGVFEAWDENGKLYLSRKLLVATGLQDNIPTIPGFKEMYGKSVFHCPYCDGWEVSDRQLAVYAKNKDGSELALSLKTWSDRVIYLTDGGKGKLKASERQYLDAAGISVITTPLEKLIGKNGRLEKIHFKNGKDIDCDALFFVNGFIQQCDLAESFGCDVGNKGAVITNKKQQTNIMGLYVAGDASRDMHFVVVAAAEGAKAGVSINKELIKEESERRRTALLRDKGLVGQ